MMLSLDFSPFQNFTFKKIEILATLKKGVRVSLENESDSKIVGLTTGGKIEGDFIEIEVKFRKGFKYLKLKKEVFYTFLKDENEVKKIYKVTFLKEEKKNDSSSKRPIF